ncbi:sensor histidine kinase [Kitasatospora sp. McL0602]|uniref:sensor histidine kinase n=1 Tax=Kitasatospora sp. McL0602 TaxID=3439530 RepID=UPI003F8C0AA0
MSVSPSTELDVLWRSPFARRVLGLGRRLRRLDRAHPVGLDSLLALLVLGAGLGDVLKQHHPHPAVLVVTLLAQALPLMWRRRAPSAVLAVVLVGCGVQWWFGGALHSATSLMIALYAVARYEPLRRLPWAALGSAGALTVAAFRVVPFERQELNSLFFFYSAATAAAALALVVRVREAQLSALADRADRLEVEREQRVQLATLAERSRVSREMHDIVGHNLAVIIGLADGASYAAAADPARSAEVLRIIAGTGRQALSELRRTLGALRERPDGPVGDAELSPQPGIADLAALLERIQEAGPRISYRTAGDLDALTPGVQLAVYRIVQEALTNSLKHAGPAAEVRVTLRATGREVDVRVQDSGRRDGAPQAPPTGQTGRTGQGLVGITERAVLAGGRAEAGPTGDGGWSVHATLPTAQKEVRP